MKPIRLCLFLLMIIASSTWLHAGEDNIPSALRTAILANYPADLLCAQENERQNGEEIPPPEQHFARGCIQVLLNGTSSSNVRVAVVTYAWPPPDDFPITDVLIFRENGEQWTRVDPIGHPGAVLHVGSQGQNIFFQDVDGDGLPEIVLRYHRPNTTLPEDPGNIFVWKLTETGLKALTPGEESTLPASWMVEETETPFPGGEPPECEQMITTVFPDYAKWSSDTGVWLKDLDGDGKLELIMGPDQARLPDPDPSCTPHTCADYWQDVTGTRIFRLVDGVYQKVGGTEVGQGLAPSLAVAMAPAAMAQEVLLMAGQRDVAPQVSLADAAGGSAGRGRGRDSQAGKPDESMTAGAVRPSAPVTLYVSPPQGYSMGDVDWSTVKVADGTLTVLADAGTHPAPAVDSYPQWWLLNRFWGVLLYLEDVRNTRPADFTLSDDDPVAFMGPGGRLHFTTPYRVLRFDRQALLEWLAEQWRAGNADHELKSCFTKDGREYCYTPIGLPLTVHTNVSLGPCPVVAHGIATLWVRD